ncbi:N-acetylmuramoyl-L-alanine amidase [Paenibacillus taihuensis]|uniref:N-acetylmuramoyl-L-alanine amidase n=1 Tax=Paenibacillus taihuensis TaxID=1156355 RepID=A0A3D9Q3T8_9BACL|nr:N-acetylmuramoyl-L-alanine amidase [Paenibacillus taihuensis]REE55393.1 N-acetylmuramoyl-L-alanine amidase [Paenibacillus taihuensis]
MRKLISLAIIMILVVGALGMTMAAANSKFPYQAKVNTTAMNVRSEPSLQASVVGQLKSGDIVTVTDEESDGWVQIKKNKLTGWAAGYLLRKLDSSGKPSNAAVESPPSSGKVSTSPGSTATVLTESLRIRSGPGTSYKVVGSLAQGEQITVSGSQGDWLKIKTVAKLAGWVSKQYVGKGAPGSVVSSGSSSGKGLRGKLIVVDAGHGGEDPGMIGTTYDTQEKTLTLSTANYLKQELLRLGARVIMTRTTDVKPELSERVRISESAHADAFISIHYNSSEKKSSGILTFFYSEKKDRPLAQAVEAELDNGIGLRSYGVSFGDLYVLRENSTVATLVELGFLSNPKDESLVRGSSYQKKAAAAIARGIADYFG